MAEANKQAIDKINQIKKKLNKYLGLKNNTKVGMTRSVRLRRDSILINCF